MTCSNRSLFMTMVLAVALSFCGTKAVDAQTILRVNAAATAGGNGSTWGLTGSNAAFKYLQDALTAAAPIAQGGGNVEIWAAAGTYKADQGGGQTPGSRNATFTLLNNVAIYGGFAGTEAQLSQRNVTANVTTLSGDLNGDDGPVANGFSFYGENSFHIVTDSAVDGRIDGFTIVGGNADGAQVPNSLNVGGGLYKVHNSPGSATVVNCTFYRNQAIHSGGALFASMTPFEMYNCRFIGNSAGNTAGAIRITGDAPSNNNLIPHKIVNCEFIGNTSIAGAALDLNWTGPVAVNQLVSCTFYGNSASSRGGAVRLQETAIVVQNCIFWGNAGAGADIYDEGGTIPRNVRHSVITASATNFAISYSETGNLSSNPQFFKVNGTDGIPFTLDDDLRPVYTSPCADAGDNATPVDAADLDHDGNVTESMPLDLSGQMRFRDNVFVSDTGLGTAPVVDIGAYESQATVTATVLYVKAGSPPQGNGSSWSTPFPNLQDALAAATTAVDLLGPVQIWVAAGTYNPAGFNGSRSATFQLQNNVALYGGFAGTETLLTERNVANNITVLSGDLNGNDNGLPQNYSENSLHVVTSPQNSSPVIDGFTIRGGNANQIPQDSLGAGLNCLSGSSPSVSNCIIDGNRAQTGAGICGVDVANPLFKNCVIKNNLGTGISGGPNGAAAYFASPGSPRFDDCVFEDNLLGPIAGGELWVYHGGAGPFLHNGPNATFIRCTFRRNIAPDHGGGLMVMNATANLVNCAFSGNIAQGTGGAGIWAQTYTPGSATTTVNATNCTFAGNDCTVGGGGGAVYLYDTGTVGVFTNCAFVKNNAGPLSPGCCGGIAGLNASLTLRNSILWGNTGTGGSGETIQLATGVVSPTISYSIVEGWTGTFGGTGNNGSNPTFLRLPSSGIDGQWGTLDDDYGDLRPGPGSAAVDSGDSSALPQDPFDIDNDGDTSEAIPLDLVGNPRFVDDPNVANTGPINPPVDRGAYENNLSTAAWTNPNGGSWTLSGNWLNSVLPNSSARAFFDDRVGSTQSAYTVTIPSDQSAYAMAILANQVTINLRQLTTNGNLSLTAPNIDPNPALLIGNVAGLDTRLTLTNTAGTNKSLTFSNGVIADTIGSVARLTVQSQRAILNATGRLEVGKAGQGTLAVDTRGTVIAGTIELGAQSAGTGSMTITGQAPFTSSVTFGGAGGKLIVGDAGIGSVSVSALGSLVGDLADEIVLGKQPGSVGTVTLTGTGTSWTNTATDFIVGESGNGTLTISGGAALNSNSGNIILAKNPGSSATINIGSGSSWTEENGSFTLAGVGGGTATLNIASGGTLSIPLGMSVNPNGTLGGSGTVQTMPGTSVFNVGRIQPDGGSPTTPGTLTINGNYQQIGPPPGGGQAQSGKLQLKIGGTMAGQFDQLAVTGTAELGGGLFVDLINGYVPGASPDLPLLDAQAGISGAHPRFDVAFFPGIPGNQFLNVSYGSNFRGPAASVSLITVPLQGQINLNDSQNSSVSGTPTAVARLADTTGDLIGDTLDVDGDGRDDLVVAVSLGVGVSGQVVVLKTAFTGGVYTPVPSVYNVGKDPSAVVVGRLTGSNRLDFAVANAGDNNVMVFTNQGGGVFGASPSDTISVGTEPMGLAVADFNGANGPDLAVANAGSDNVSVLNNNGTGDFSTIVSRPAGIRPIMVEPIDPDQDKDIDLATGNQNGNSVMIMPNVGGTINPPIGATTFSVGSGPVQLIAANLDGAGASEPNDLVTVNQVDGTVSVLVNNGNVGTISFAPAVNLPVRPAATSGSDPTSLEKIDLDGDGDLDLAVVSNDDTDSSRIVRVLRNDQTLTLDPVNGQLAFASSASQAAGTNPSAVVASDLDADNRNDLVTINDTGLLLGRGAPSGEVAVRLNSLPGDMNCDGEISLSDVAPFVQALLDPAGYAIAFPTCQITRADVNIDTTRDGRDVSNFVKLLAP